MSAQGGEREESNEARVRVERAEPLARLHRKREVAEEGFHEPAVLLERDSAKHVPQRDAKHDGHDRRGRGEHEVEEGTPTRVMKLRTELDRDSAQNEEPKHHRHREIEPAEGGRVGSRKGEDEHASRADQPHVVAVPHGPHGGEHGAAFLVRLGDEKMHDSGPEIEAVEHRNSQSWRKAALPAETRGDVPSAVFNKP